MLQLVCEGACNPDRSGCDAAVRMERAKQGDPEGIGVEPVSAMLASRLRRLVHTAHRTIGDVHAQCVTCGTTRRYGRTL